MSSKLKDIRVEAGIGPIELSKKAGISDKTLNKIENKNLGKETTRRKILIALNELTGKTHSYEDAYTYKDS